MGVFEKHNHETNLGAAAEQSSDESKPDVEVQNGVRKMEAMGRQWTTTTLWTAYISIALLGFLLALQGATTSGLTNYVTSQFLNSASGIPTINIITSILYTVVKPPMAKVADTFGRTEAFITCIFFYVLGLIMMASCKTFNVFAAAQIFYVAGSTGLSIVFQIFFADTTTLVNRALFIIIPVVPYTWTWAAGPSIAGDLIAKGTDKWRWAYGIFCIIVPIVFFPLGIVMIYTQRKAYNSGYYIPKRNEYGWKKTFDTVFWQLDIVGIILLTAGLTCFLLPFTLGGGTAAGWRHAHNIVMIIVGPLCIVAWVIWSLHYAKNPILNLRLLKNRTVACACISGALYFMAFYLWDNYFYAFMIMAKNQSYAATGRITQTFDLASTTTVIVIGVILKYTGRYKWIISCGLPIYTLGIGLMVAFRNVDDSIAKIVVAQVIVGVRIFFFFFFFLFCFNIYCIIF